MWYPRDMPGGWRRFTLVEMMIVVAIVMVLAAIAIPELHEAQLKAKRGEVLVNVPAIRVADVAYAAAFDVYIGTLTYNPTSAWGKSRRPWDTSVSGWSALGWRPDGDVYGTYAVDPSAPNCLPIANNIQYYVQTNLDGVGGSQSYACCLTGATEYTSGNGLCGFRYAITNY